MAVCVHKMTGFFSAAQTPPESPKRATVRVGCTLSPAAARWKLTSRTAAIWSMESTKVTCMESRLTPYTRWWRLDASAYLMPTLRYTHLAMASPTVTPCFRMVMPCTQYQSRHSMNTLLTYHQHIKLWTQQPWFHVHLMNLNATSHSVNSVLVSNCWMLRCVHHLAGRWFCMSAVWCSTSSFPSQF